jgi:hypothetical protein
LAISISMNKGEARSILSECLAGYRLRSRQELAARVSEGRVDAREVVAPNGTKYQLEIQFVWDAEPNGDVRVIASIDDGGIRALLPLTDGFIVGSDGRFVGE